MISTAALSNDAVHWFVVLHLFPAIVAAPLKRGGKRNASSQVQRRLHMWRESKWKELSAELWGQEPPRRATPTSERTEADRMQASAEKTRDGYISRGAAVHDGGQVCPDGDEKEAACRKLHHSASANGGHRVQDGQNASRIQLDANSVWAAASTIAKSAALWTQPMHVRTVV